MDNSHNTDIETAIWSDSDDVETVESNEEQRANIADKVFELLALYWKRRVLAGVIIGAGILLSVAYALSLQPYFVSNTTLMPQDNSSPYSSMLSMFSNSGGAGTLGSEALGLSTPSELQMAILQSRTVLYAMIARFDLMSYYKVQNVEQARQALVGNTKIDQDRKSGVITITVTSSTPQLAAKLADGYVVELNRVLTESSTSAAGRERQFLEGRLKDVRQDLDESSKALSQFSTKTKALDIPTQARSLVEATQRLESLISESRSQLAALKQTYSEDNYRVKAVEARLVELQRQLNTVEGNSGALNSGHEKRDSSYPGVTELPGLGVTYSELERKVRADEALWESLTKQYELARVQEAKEIPTVHVLDPAIVPNHKAGPRRSWIVLIGTFVALLLSFVAIFGRAGWENMSEDSLPKKLVARINKTQAAS